MVHDGCVQLLSQHDFKVSVTSAEILGQGSTFAAFLPLLEEGFLVEGFLVLVEGFFWEPFLQFFSPVPFFVPFFGTFPLKALVDPSDSRSLRVLFFPFAWHGSFFGDGVAACIVRNLVRPMHLTCFLTFPICLVSTTGLSFLGQSYSSSSSDTCPCSFSASFSTSSSLLSTFGSSAKALACFRFRLLFSVLVFCSESAFFCFFASFLASASCFFRSRAFFFSSFAFSFSIFSCCFFSFFFCFASFLFFFILNCILRVITSSLPGWPKRPATSEEAAPA